MIAVLLQVAADGALNWGPVAGGGGMAAAMFYFYRQDRKASEDRFATIIQDLRAGNDRLVMTIEANTRAMTALEKAIEHDVKVTR